MTTNIEHTLEAGWYLVEEHPHRIIRIGEPGHRHRVNSYIVTGDDRSAVIDTGLGFADFCRITEPYVEAEPILLLTHAHWDHVGAAHQFQSVYVHHSEVDDLRQSTPNQQLQRWFDERHLFGVTLPDDLDPENHYIPGIEPTGTLSEGDIIDLGNRPLEVLHTPGHSTGGLSFLDRKSRALFTGDAIYAGSMLCNFSGTDPNAYRETLRRLAGLASEIDVLYPGHQDAPIPSSELHRMHEAFEGIWSGAYSPSIRRRGVDIFRFDGFSFWLTEGSYGHG